MNKHIKRIINKKTIRTYEVAYVTYVASITVAQWEAVTHFPTLRQVKKSLSFVEDEMSILDD